MLQHRIRALALLFCVAAAPAFGQSRKAETAAPAAKPSTDPAKPDASERPRPTFSLFGDPSRFTRLGGWGGMASTMGQFGVTKAMLVMMPGVQQELKLTDKQKEKLKEWAEDFRKKGEKLAKEAGLNPGGPPPELQNGANAQNVGAQIFKMMNFFTTLNDFFKEAEDAANKILTKPQQTRLSQLALQMEGLQGLTKPEVARAMNLDAGQVEAINQILTNARTGQMTYWVGQMTQMAARGGFRRPGGPPRGENGGEAAPGQDAPRDYGRPRAEAATGKTETAKSAGTGPRPKAEEPTDPAEIEKQRAEREKQRAEMRQRFQKMQEGSDSIHNVATAQILKVLTKGQKAKFEKMLGEPFDPTNLIPQQERDRAALEAAAAETRRKAEAGIAAQAKPEPARPSTLRERRQGKTAPPQ